MGKKELLIAGVYAVTLCALTAKTPTVPATNDYAFYVRMAQGDFDVPSPFNTRIFVPFLAGLFGGTEEVFHYMNLSLSVVTCIMLAYHFRDYIAPLFFLLGTIQLRYSLGEPSLDAMIYLLVASSLIVTEKKLTFTMPLISVVAAMTHPIAFVLTAVIFVLDRKPYVVVLGGLVFFTLFQTQMGLYPLTFSRVLWGLWCLSFLWIGLFTLRRDRESLRDVLLLACCSGFTLLASNVGRMMAPVGMLLAPRASGFLVKELK